MKQIELLAGRERVYGFQTPSENLEVSDEMGPLEVHEHTTSNATTFQQPFDVALKWHKIRRRQTTDIDTGKIIEDITDIQERKKDELFGPLPDGTMSIKTRFYFHPFAPEPVESQGGGNPPPAEKRILVRWHAG